MKKLSFLMLFLAGNIAISSAATVDYSCIADTVKPEIEEKKAIKVVESMPRFPGCEDMEGSDREKKACADKKMLEYLYSQIKYPSIAIDKGVEGVAVVSFIIEVDGSITNAKIVRDPGAGCGDEALRVINTMNNLPVKWTPGYQKGEAVRVIFNLPIRFRLTQPKPLTRKERRQQKRAARKQN